MYRENDVCSAAVVQDATEQSAPISGQRDAFRQPAKLVRLFTIAQCVTCS